MDKKEIDLKSVYESVVKLSEFCSSNVPCRSDKSECPLYDKQNKRCVLTWYDPCDWRKIITLVERTTYGIGITEPFWNSTTKIPYPSEEES